MNVLPFALFVILNVDNLLGLKCYTNSEINEDDDELIEQDCPSQVSHCLTANADDVWIHRCGDINDSRESECVESAGETVNTTTCYCDKDLCNGAPIKCYEGTLLEMKEKKCPLGVVNCAMQEKSTR